MSEHCKTNQIIGATKQTYHRSTLCFVTICNYSLEKNCFLIVTNNGLLKMRHEAKTAYSQNTVQRLKTYNKIKLQGVHKYVIYNDNYKHIKTM